MRNNNLKRRLVFTFSLAMASSGALGALAPRTAAAAVTCAGSNLCNQGGRVLTAPKVYVIFWGWNTANDPQQLMNIPSNFVSYMNGTPYMNVLTQYGVGNSTSASLLGGTYFESSPLPADTAANNPNWDPAIAAMAKKYANQTGKAADRNAVWVVATPHRTNHPGGYCARHGSIANGSNPAVPYVDLPYQTDYSPNCYGGLAKASDAESIVLWHELTETFTDPRYDTEGPAFLDNAGAEIADKCNTTAADPPQLALTRVGNYALAPIWSNATNFGNGICAYAYRTNEVLLEAGTDLKVYNKAGSSWPAWSFGGQQIISNPGGLRFNLSTNTTPSIRSDVFAIAANGHLVHGWKASEVGSEANSQEDLGAPPAGYVFVGRPAVVSKLPGTLSIYVRATNPFGASTIITRPWPSAPIQVGPLWTEVNGPSSSFTPCSAPTVTFWTIGNTPRTDIFYLGCQADPHLMHLYSNGTGWSGDDWGTSTASGHGSFRGAPAVTSWGDSRLDIFVADHLGQMQHVWWDSGWSGWDNWGKPGSTTFKPEVSAAAQGDFRLAVAGTGQDGNIYEATWGRANDAGWVSRGHAAASANGTFNFSY